MDEDSRNNFVDFSLNVVNFSNGATNSISETSCSIRETTSDAIKSKIEEYFPDLNEAIATGRDLFEKICKFRYPESNGNCLPKYVYEIIIEREMEVYKGKPIEPLIDSVSAAIEVIDNYCGSCSNLKRFDEHRNSVRKLISD